VRIDCTAEDSVSCATAEGAGRIPAEYASGAPVGPWVGHNSAPPTEDLLERVFASANMQRAWKQVKRNKGAAGVDGRSIGEAHVFLRAHWPALRQALLAETYQPFPVLRVSLPKPGGGVRHLGIPTVVDRLIQQAICQVLTPIFDPGFSEFSYGFRPGRSAHDAVHQALAYQQDGCQWVVDLDLKQFFDEVDHDILMSRIGRKVTDKRLKRLINAYLTAGILCPDGLRPSVKGTPQGGPLSPLLSNILLDDLDKELERRGHSFCRYADDCQVYVRTRRAGDRVLHSITQYVEGLKLKVNHAKSAVARPWKRTFLGFTFLKVFGNMRLHLPAKTLHRFRSRVKQLLHVGRGRNVARFIREQLNLVLRGWMQYFAPGASKRILTTLDFWLRRRLRCVIWRQWKRPRTRFNRLVGLGCSSEQAVTALNRRGPWRNSALPILTHALSPTWFRALDLYGFLDHLLPRD